MEGSARQSCLDPGYRRSWSGSLSCQHRPASCTVQGTCKQFGRCFSGRSSAKLGLQNNFKWTGIVLQCRLHEKSARQTNSKTNRQASSWCRAIPARLLSSTQLYDTLALAPNSNGNTNSAALEEAAGGEPFLQLRIVHTATQNAGQDFSGLHDQTEHVRRAPWLRGLTKRCVHTTRSSSFCVGRIGCIVDVNSRLPLSG